MSTDLEDIEDNWNDFLQQRRKSKARKSALQTLYVNRRLLNAGAIRVWAREQGFESVLPAEEMHVTLAYSKEPVDWSAIEPMRDAIVVIGGSVEKYNPNHDELGRFAEGEGGGGTVGEPTQAEIDQVVRLAEQNEGVSRYEEMALAVTDESKLLVVRSGGKVVAAISYLQEGKSWEMTHLGSLEVGGGRALVTRVEAEARAAGATELWGLPSPTSHGFWRKMGFVVEHVGDNPRVTRLLKVVEKFNPNHDELGRFASGDGGPLGDWTPAAGETIVAFHGTADVAVRDIMANGLTVGKSQNFDANSPGYEDDHGKFVDFYKDDRGRAVFVANSEKTALWYARNAAGNDQSKLPVVLELHIPKDAFGRFKSDLQEQDVGSAYTSTTIPSSWIKGARQYARYFYTPPDTGTSIDLHKQDVRVLYFAILTSADVSAVTKFNPNHDERGRFADGPGGGGFSPRNIASITGSEGQEGGGGGSDGGKPISHQVAALGSEVYRGNELESEVMMLGNGGSLQVRQASPERAGTSGSGYLGRASYQYTAPDGGKAKRVSRARATELAEEHGINKAVPRIRSRRMLDE